MRKRLGLAGLSLALVVAAVALWGWWPRFAADELSRPNFDGSESGSVQAEILVPDQKTRVRLPLRPGRDLTLDLEPTEPIGEYSTWAGLGSGIESMVVVRSGVNVGALITTAEGKFQLLDTGSGAVLKKLPDKYPAEHLPILLPGVAPDPVPVEKNQADPGNGIIDVVIGYTREARDEAGGDAAVKTVIALIVEDANMSFYRSYSKVRVRLLTKVCYLGQRLWRSHAQSPFSGGVIAADLSADDGLAASLDVR